MAYTATVETHERIAAFANALASSYGDGDAREAIYQAVVYATADFSRGAKGSDVLAYLQRRFAGRDPERPADGGLDFGGIGEAAA